MIWCKGHEEFNASVHVTKMGLICGYILCVPVSLAGSVLHHVLFHLAIPRFSQRAVRMPCKWIFMSLNCLLSIIVCKAVMLVFQ